MLAQMPSDESELRVALTVADTEVEGPGRRFAVWVQGCRLRCAGCCNPDMLPFEGGTVTRVDVLAARVFQTAGIEGVTMLGGEPFDQASAVARLARRVRNAGLSVMVFSGYRLEELEARGCEATNALLDATDLLVDGPFIAALPETRRRWIGSSNQRMHFLTGRYSPSDERFVAPNELEIRVEGGELRVIGWPAAAAKLVRSSALRRAKSA